MNIVLRFVGFVCKCDAVSFTHLLNAPSKVKRTVNSEEDACHNIHFVELFGAHLAEESSSGKWIGIVECNVFFEHSRQVK
ncbi:unnamed protein product [Larinioides sclopetarius]|uniref:Uncharacterized protein n=1 Tax=Larinioides sclopetarius TaxID=280406 RepID=A0AAV2AGN1_9ARAC